MLYFYYHLQYGFAILLQKLSVIKYAGIPAVRSNRTWFTCISFKLHAGGDTEFLVNLKDWLRVTIASKPF